MAKRSRDASMSPETDGSSDEDPLPLTKQAELDTSAQDVMTQPVMHCDLPPHKDTVSFPTYDEYEIHYNKYHTNRCSACGKNFPTPYFLSLHMEENHNPLREALVARGVRTYGCFVEDCDRKCSTPQKRRLHLIDKHMFPRSYNFRIVDKGIDGVDSMLSSGPRRRISGFNDTPDKNLPGSRRRSGGSISTSATARPGKALQTVSKGRGDPDATDLPSTSITKPATDNDCDIERLGSAMSALKFVPSSVQRKKQT